jgi:hypothetical protein
MPNIDWDKIEKRCQPDEIYLIVAKFGVNLKWAPIDLTVEVREYPNGRFMAFSNYGYWGPNQANAYKSMQLCNTIEDAVIDSITGLSAFRDAKDEQQFIFWEKRDPANPSAHIYVDGTGEAVTKKEVDERRKEWRAKHPKP